MTRNEYFQKVGEYFGYPSCCIQSFIDFVDQQPMSLRTKEQVDTAKDGFVPCPFHAYQISKGEITLESLITNRISKSPFPLDDSPEDRAYINSLKS